MPVPRPRAALRRDHRQDGLRPRRPRRRAGTATLELTLDGPDRKRLTANDGELLSALEFVLDRMGRRAWPDEPPLRLVCRGFRSERDDELVEMVREAAAQVAAPGCPAGSTR